MTGRIILSALLSRPTLVRNVGEVKTKQLMFAAMVQPEREASRGGAGSSFCSFRGSGPAVDGGDKDGDV
jgi:hypothetical protein